MYIVRDYFTAKPGCAGKLAKLFKRVFANEPGFRVMTDFVGQYNTVEMEFQASNLAEFEEHVKAYMEGRMEVEPELAKEMKAYTELWTKGGREIFKVVE
jgi:hypothetical protein